MKFSIIVPVYNKQDYLVTTLRSILDQRFTDFEILIIDDGSTDNSVAVIKEFSDPRIKLSLQKNSGVSIARNKGIDEAVGEWICFLDADDWHHPDYLFVLDEMSSLYQSADVMATRFVCMPDTPNWSPKAWELSEKKYEWIENLPERWVKGNPFFTSSVAVRRIFLQTMQPCFPPGEHSGEDLDLWFRLGEKKPILLLCEPLVVYRTAVSNSLSHIDRSLTAPYLLRMAQRSSGLTSSLRRSTLKYVTQSYISMARVAACSGQRGRALGFLLGEYKRGILIPRWWSSLFLFLFLPASVITKFNHWRVSRTQINVKSLKQMNSPEGV